MQYKILAWKCGLCTPNTNPFDGRLACLADVINKSAMHEHAFVRVSPAKPRVWCTTLRWHTSRKYGTIAAFYFIFIILSCLQLQQQQPDLCHWSHSIVTSLIEPRQDSLTAQQRATTVCTENLGNCYMLTGRITSFEQSTASKCSVCLNIILTNTKQYASAVINACIFNTLPPAQLYLFIKLLISYIKRSHIFFHTYFGNISPIKCANRSFYSGFKIIS